MKVFISWSGDQSKKYAEAIRDWLPAVLQMVDPYFTPSDIEKGTRWSTDIAKELESSQIGIICVTRDNLHADWILFEAGALSKSLEKSHICPVTFGMSSTDLAGPLKQFQTTEFERKDFQKLVSVINARLGEHKLSTKVLENVFDKWWPDLEEKIKAISSRVAESETPVRSDRELIEEILTISRASFRAHSRPTISSQAVKELLEIFIELHDDQANGIGGYQDVLDILKRAEKPMRHIANHYKGSSGVMDAVIDRFTNLTYNVKTAISETPEDDDEIPF